MSIDAKRISLDHSKRSGSLGRFGFDALLGGKSAVTSPVQVGQGLSRKKEQCAWRTALATL